MIIDLSYTSKKNTNKIIQILGKPFGFMERLKMGGIGSPRLNLIDADDQVSELMNQDINRNVCNIELRPKGIIIGFRSKLNPYALLMHYDALKIINLDPDVYRVESKKHFITFRVRKRDKSTHRFIQKLKNARRVALNLDEE